MKKFFLLCLSFTIFAGFSFAQQYTFYYGEGCGHCAKVEAFFEKTNADKIYKVDSKEIYFNPINRDEALKHVKALNITDRGVPLFIIKNATTYKYLVGDQPIISFFKEKLAADKANAIPDANQATNTGETTTNTSGSIIGSTDTIETMSERIAFFGIMLPAALADSINPCAFAVMLLLLTAIITKKKKRRTVILSGLLFSFAIFGSYLLMGLGMLQALANSNNTMIFKIIVGILGILVGLANLKDYFRYKKGFVMEVPLSRRPTMKKVITKVTSPFGAFVIGIIVSLFLLPCTSGPYLTILGFLHTKGVGFDRNLIYIVVYNLIFILPMLVITFLVGLGYANTKALTKLKNNNAKLIHLLVGILMLGLGIYILATM